MSDYKIEIEQMAERPGLYQIRIGVTVVTGFPNFMEAAAWAQAWLEKATRIATQEQTRRAYLGAALLDKTGGKETKQ